MLKNIVISQHCILNESSPVKSSTNFLSIFNLLMAANYILRILLILLSLFRRILDSVIVQPFGSCNVASSEKSHTPLFWYKEEVRYNMIQRMWSQSHTTTIIKYLLQKCLDQVLDCRMSHCHCSQPSRNL